MAKFEGQLTFDINSGKFWITKMADYNNNEEIEEAGIPLTSLEFGDEFEVKDKDGNWVKSGLEITNDEKGNLLFKLKNTNYQGMLDGIEVRQ